MLGIYLCSCVARHKDYNIVYQDIDLSYNPDISGNMLDIDISKYDYVICTPPCNWWSRMNIHRIHSKYAWSTLHLLPMSIIKCSNSHKPFIIENVINRKRFTYMGIYELCEYYHLKVIEIGRHTYITNVIEFNPSRSELYQTFDFKRGGIKLKDYETRQGGNNVHVVIEEWLKCIGA